MARRRIILLNTDVVVTMLRGEWTLAVDHDRWIREVTSDVPADLRIVGCGWDESRNIVRIAVESETFTDVPDGQFAPEWVPTYTAHEVTEFEAAMMLMGRKAP
jgi:hypothetical protein